MEENKHKQQASAKISSENSKHPAFSSHSPTAMAKTLEIQHSAGSMGTAESVSVATDCIVKQDSRISDESSTKGHVPVGHNVSKKQLVESEFQKVIRKLKSGQKSVVDISLMDGIPDFKIVAGEDDDLINAVAVVKKCIDERFALPCEGGNFVVDIESPIDNEKELIAKLKFALQFFGKRPVDVNLV